MRITTNGRAVLCETIEKTALCLGLELPSNSCLIGTLQESWFLLTSYQCKLVLSVEAKWLIFIPESVLGSCAAQYVEVIGTKDSK